MPENDISNWDQLCQAAEKSQQRHKVPGIVVGVLHNGEVSTAAYGVTNLEHPLEVTDQTLFQIGSITKTFAGTLAMKLVEAGKLDLDAPVRTYLPDFKVLDPEASEKVSLRHLMTHTSGWVGDLFIDTGTGDDAPAKYMAEMAELEQMAPLGQIWSYNNSGFYLLGYVIEQVTGKSFPAALQEMILEPLELSNTFFDPADVLTHRFAAGHVGGQVARPWALPRAAYPAGGITCSVHDLLAYARFHMGDGRRENGDRLLEQDSLAQMQSPVVTVWQEEKWGLTWSVDDTHGTRLVSHSGGTNGQGAQLLMAPEDQFALAIFTNSDNGEIVVDEVTHHALKTYLGIKPAAPEPQEVAEEELAPLVGTYTRPFADIHVGLLGGRLIAQLIYKRGFPAKDSPPSPSPPPFTLCLIEEDRLMILDGPMKFGKADIIRNPDGTIGWVRTGRLHRKVE